MSKTPKKWTPEEDKTLLDQVSLMASQGKAKDWTAIAAALPERSNKDCRKRWCNHLVGGLRKGPWDPSEDQRLAIGVQEHGQQWPLVAEEVGTRSADQCAKRWQHSLDPELDHSKWTEEEERSLLNAVEKHGRAWKDIRDQYFPGRATNNVKNRYVTLTRRRGSRASTFAAEDGNANYDSDSSSNGVPVSDDSIHPAANNTSTVCSDPDVALLANIEACNPFDLDLFPRTDSADPNLSSTAPDTFLPELPFEFLRDCLALDPSAVAANADQAAHASMMAVDPQIGTTFHPNSSAELVLSIENPSPETVTSVIGLLVGSNTKFRMEIK